MAKSKVGKSFLVLMVLVLVLSLGGMAKADEVLKQPNPLGSYQTGNDVVTVSTSADGTLIAAGSWDNKVYLFTSSSGVSPPAYPEEPEGKCWAVIIGVSDYQRSEDLRGCAEDAEGLSQLLRPIWGEEHIKLLLNSEATKAKIQAAIEWLAANEGTNDTVLFYFGGHGSKGDIAPYDAFYIDTWTTSRTLNQWLSALDSKRVAIILDTCNPASDKLSDSGRVILASCGTDEFGWTAFTAGGDYHLVFSHYLLEAISEFTSADANRDYELSAEEIFRYAEPKTISVTSRFEDTQHPVLSDQYPGELSLLMKFIFKTEPELPMPWNVLVLDDKEYSSVPVELTWAPGSVHNLTVLSPQGAFTHTRYVFTSWNDGDISVSRTISRGGVYTANFKKQYQLLIESAYGKPKGEGWYDAGSTATLKVMSIIEKPATKHFFTGWSGDYSGDAATASVAMDSPKTITAKWRTEYLLTIESVYGEPQGAGWYDASSSATISVAPIQGIIIRHIFTGWSGDYSGDTATASVTMGSPTAVTANWRTDYIQLYILIGVIVLVVAIITGLRIRRRREAG